MSYGAEMEIGCSEIVLPCESLPLVTVSAPGRPLKRLSTERFSCTMITTCWITPYGIVPVTLCARASAAAGTVPATRPAQPAAIRRISADKRFMRDERASYGAGGPPVGLLGPFDRPRRLLHRLLPGTRAVRRTQPDARAYDRARRRSRDAPRADRPGVRPKPPRTDCTSTLPDRPAGTQSAPRRCK